MREVLEFQGKIKPAIELAGAFARSQPEIVAIKDAVYNLQLAVYWLKEAGDHLYNTQIAQDEIISPIEGNEIFPPATPTIEDPAGMLSITFGLMHKLADEIYAYLDRGIDSKSKFMLESALTRITEAKYSIVITNLYYERLQTTRGIN